MQKLNELVPVMPGNIGGEPASLVSAKQLHAFLCVGRDFTTWIKGRIDQYGFIAGVDFIAADSLRAPVSGSANIDQFTPKWGKTSGGGRPGTDYLITTDMGKELAMVERNDKGREVRRYFIRCERQVKALVAVPPSYPEALRLAADLSEKATRLESMLVDAAPKIDFADRVAEISKGISIPNYAKTVGLGPIKLFEWMRQQGVLIGGGQRHNLPMQRYIDSGYFAVRQGTYEANGEVRASFTTMLTGKGEQWLTKKLIAGGLLQEIKNAGA